MADKIAMVTGHRPKSLFGYNLLDPGYTRIRAAVRKILVREGASELWTGMALGSDMLAALAVIDMQDDGIDIRLNAAIPFEGHKDGRWPKETQDLYDAILYRSARTDLVTDGPFSAWALELRNRYMADRADFAIAIYNGTPGGTQRCIKYLRKIGKPVWFIDPKNPEEPVFVPAKNPA